MVVRPGELNFIHTESHISFAKILEPLTICHELQDPLLPILEYHSVRLLA